jgi:hypothetical protein
VIAFTAEELYLLADGTPIPGLGPLPLDESSLRLMRGTAERSLIARGLLGAREVTALLDPLADPDWFATAVRGTRRAWARRGDRATELVQVGPTDYTLAAADDLPARIADFLDLHGTDDTIDDPETPDEARMRALLAPPAELIETTRAARGDIVALQWIDPGDGGPVWLLSDGDPVQVSRTGRAALRARLS